jgi:uncharacterized protein (TIGR00251 family)
MKWVEDTTGGCILQVRVTPRSSRNQVDGPRDGALKIRLNAPPVEGKANEALIEFLADQLAMPRRNILLLAGEQSRNKRLLLRGCTATELARRLVDPEA